MGENQKRPDCCHDDNVRLAELLRSQGNVSQLLMGLLRDPDIDKIINEILVSIVEKFDADRSYIFSFDLGAHTHSCVYEVTKQGITSEMDDLQDYPIEAAQWWCDELLAGYRHIIEDVNSLLPDHPVEFDVLDSQSINSLMVVPLFSDAGVWGYIGVDIVGHHRTWSPTEQQWFQSLSNYISVCLHMYRVAEQARRRAEESDRLKSTFLANMSHEIRTPLNAIVGFSNLLGETTDPTERDMFMDIIHQNNDQLLQLIGDVLDLSKIEAGVMEVNKANFDVNALCEAAVSSVAMKAQPGVQVSFVPGVQDCTLYSDRNRLMQVLTNYLGNAVKFTAAGHITLGYKVDGANIEFWVEDTGTGMSKQQTATVFDRFVKFNQFVSGTSLRLSICKSIAEKLGGTVGVTSKEGKGSRFTVRLPYVSQPEGAVASPAALQPVPPAARSIERRPLVLIVEDVDSNAMLLRKAIEHTYDTIRAATGTHALKLYRQRRPDAVLMDIELPEMDGLEVTRRIRENDKQIPVIAVTAHAFEADRRAAIEAGCTDFMAKQVFPKDLRTMLAKYLQ
ncbi:MAG: response regulator [Rikenellaceae bacterium]|jgi:signal transduction histidine kinase/CheY-like chemotaxis protein|nr:response regulator [Rikenellaceae bacterium]